MKTRRHRCLVALLNVAVHGYVISPPAYSRGSWAILCATPTGKKVDGDIPTGRVVDRDAWIDISSHSLQALTGTSLYDRMHGIDCAAKVHETTRYAVLSHGIQDDPIFCYFNEGALQLFEWPESEIYQLPSRYSAPEGELRDDRSNRISAASEQKFSVIPSAIRQTKSGALFEMNDVLLWNVYDREGVRVGQTALVDCSLVKPIMSA